MRRFAIILVLAFSGLQLAAQNSYLKGVIIPTINHTVGYEYRFNKVFGIQLLLQHHWEMPFGEIDYQNFRAMPGFRFYLPAKNEVINDLYLSTYFRAARIIQNFEGPPFDNRTNTAGVGANIGKQFNVIKGALKFEVGFGAYYIFGDGEWWDYSEYNLFRYRKGWRASYELLIAVPISKGKARD